MSAVSNTINDPPEGREGMVTVYDSMTGKYLGCMGRETWEKLLSKDVGSRSMTPGYQRSKAPPLTAPAHRPFAGGAA